jgi:hypothetical protein
MLSQFVPPLNPMPGLYRLARRKAWDTARVLFSSHSAPHGPPIRIICLDVLALGLTAK